MQDIFDIYAKHPVVTTDTRDCPAGSIFVALKGATFDGNQFAADALRKGCAYAIVSEKPSLSAADGDLESRLIVVDDTLQALKLLAREHRRQFDIPVVGITGTNGKTTTKELTRAVLSAACRVMATEGNFNNDVGVPKTLFRLTADDDIAVVEMGASHPGDIKTLVETAEPTCGLITNVGRAHLQGFGSFEGVCRTKGELYDFLCSRSLPVFVDRDNEYLMGMLADARQKAPAGEQADVYYYGQSDNSDIVIRGEVVSCKPFLTFRWREQDADAGYCSEWMEVKTHLIGSYNLNNILAAITVGYVNGIPFDLINEAIAGYTPTNNRSQLTQTADNCLIVDAYNANPTSMKAAIDNFRIMDVPSKMAILGMMGELGDVSEAEHRSVVEQLDAAAFDDVWLVGSDFEAVGTHYRTFHDVGAVKAELEARPLKGRTILIKGSNSTRLFELPALL